jgi:hypothetical protein
MSRAPTAGGQYHWISELSPRKYQKKLSYITGMPPAVEHHSGEVLTNPSRMAVCYCMADRYGWHSLRGGKPAHSSHRIE